MTERRTSFVPVQSSLADLLGEDYGHAICEARSCLTGTKQHSLSKIVEKKVDFYPSSFQKKLLSLLPKVGTVCSSSIKHSIQGAGTKPFEQNTKTAMAPLSGMGFYRIGENGRLYFISKSEHYHCSLGHHFPGYRLVEYAKQLGILNATHNNTRGYITRLLEEELLRTAAGIGANDNAFQQLLGSKRKNALNRVLNLETGSIAAEAAIKLCLSRFYRSQKDSPKPKYDGRIPVLVTIGDDQGGPEANYHGTTMIAQVMRGMWPSMLQEMEKKQLFLVRNVQANRIEQLEKVFATYEGKNYKIAGFFHELIMMNYGAKRLREGYVKRAYTLCRKHDIPTVVDEIQTCVWSPELFLFREYGVSPSMAVVGKGFPGGEYAASRILFSSTLDNLPQFGALVTNGQEELASLCYLITMKWVKANADVIRSIGDEFEERLRDMALRYPGLIEGIDGKRHMLGVYFHDVTTGQRFVKAMQKSGLDISVQTYKKDCPPVALTKLPLICGYEAVDFVLQRMEESLKRI